MEYLIINASYIQSQVVSADIIFTNKLTAENIEAIGGTVGGLTLSENSIVSDTGNFSVTSEGYLTAKSGNIAGFEIGSGTRTSGASIMYYDDDIDTFGITARSYATYSTGLAFEFTLDSAYQSYKAIIYYNVVYIPSGSSGSVGTLKVYSATKAAGSLSTGKTLTDIALSDVSYSSVTSSDALADGADPAQAVITAVELFAP